MKRKIYLIIEAVLLLILFNNSAHSQGATFNACLGKEAIITASLETAGSITNPIYRWYSAPTGGTPIYTGSTFVTSTVINSDTIFYVSVGGDNYCEGLRLTVNVIVGACVGDVTTCIGEKATMTASLETAGSITSPVFTWYSSPTGGTVLGTSPTFTTATGLTTDTAFYVSVKGTNYCEGPRRRVSVMVEACADYEATKSARLLPNTFVENGAYSNPVSILGNEEVEYTLTARNTRPYNSVAIVITDTLPAYMEYVQGSASPAIVTPEPPPYTGAPHNNPARQVLTWRFPSVSPNSGETVSFKARPQAGAAASQPLFINRATASFVRAPGDSTHVQTNGTFHQGAGVSIMTFSAGIGGEIFNATEQALDYMSTPTAGIIIAPEEGYKFAGWSHRGYTSLRGAAIKAQAGIMHYDTLIVYGNVELHAEFVPVEMLMMEEQEDVEIEMSDSDKAWAVKDELFITTVHEGSIVRIYTTEGILRELHTIVSAGTTSRKLSRGIYIVTINNGIGHKVRIE